jgi:AIR synthase-related protein
VTLEDIANGLRGSRGVAHKRDVAVMMETLARNAVPGAPPPPVPVGDDCAAIPDGDGWLLLAIEGFIDELVECDPWFAGWCGVMVNVSDVFAMGGRPIAVVDALWSAGTDRAVPILEGMSAAARTYGVPIVGGHTNGHNDREQLAVAILGRSQHLLTSFDAKPGDVLIAAIDLRGAYRDPYPVWDAATGTDPARLRGDLDVLTSLAELGLCVAAKDIGNAGVVGTALMLLECSGVGGVIDVRAVPRPHNVPDVMWLLSTFPSYGFLLAAPEHNVPQIRARFAARGIAGAVIGRCDDTGVARLTDGIHEATLWDFGDTALIGCGPQAESRR